MGVLEKRISPPRPPDSKSAALIQPLVSQKQTLSSEMTVGWLPGLEPRFRSSNLIDTAECSVFKVPLFPLPPTRIFPSRLGNPSQPAALPKAQVQEGTAMQCEPQKDLRPSAWRQKDPRRWYPGPPPFPQLIFHQAWPGESRSGSLGYLWGAAWRPAMATFVCFHTL